MKVSKAQAQANRAHIVETAASLFRERGYDGVGVADLMAAAGFTHGGFYKHFGSKTDLMAEAASCGLAQSAEVAAGMDLAGFLTYYLSATQGYAWRWLHDGGAMRRCLASAGIGKSGFRGGYRGSVVAPDPQDGQPEAGADDEGARVASP